MTHTQDAATDRNALARYQLRRRALLFVAILLGAGLAMVIAPAWPYDRISEYVQFWGLALIWAGILGRIWSIFYIGGRKSMEVVTDGPYSMMRNPLYFFSTVAAGGMGMQSGSLFAGLALAVLCYGAFSIVIRREEAFLSGTFGKPYADYCATVPRFFPAISKFRDAQQVTFEPKRFYWTLVDGLVFFAALPLFETAEYLQNAGWLPVLLRLY